MSFILNLLGFFYDLVFGCHHNRQTRPFTLEQQTYKVCLDCGRQIYYSPERMTPLSAREIRRMKAAQAGMLTMVPSATHLEGLLAAHDKTNAAA